MPVPKVSVLERADCSFIVKKDGKEKEKRTAKGMKKCVTEREIRHVDYKDCLTKTLQSHSMMQIRSVNHQLQAATVTKTSLSTYDDKHYILQYGYSTLAYGHYKI